MEWIRYATWPKDRLINWNAVRSGQTTQERKRICRQELDRLGPDLALTDVMMHLEDGGLHMMELLAEEASGGLRDERGRMSTGSARMFRLRCLRKPDGTPHSPGDVIEWKAGLITTDEYGRPLTTATKRARVRRGEPLELTNVATVDPSGCISVPFSDASYLLHTGGMGTSTYREKGSGTGGVYYWRWAEEPLWLLDGQERTEKPRRGRPVLAGSAEA